jgi:hypothetical protein
MSVTLDDLTEAGFAEGNWPDDLPEPGEANIDQFDLDGSEERYRYAITDGGQEYGMEVDLDTSTVPDPAEGVVYMLNQFAFLWRTDKSEIEAKGDGSYRRVDF